MAVDDILGSIDLPGVSVNTDEALASTVRRGRARRQRRACAIGACAVLVVVGLAAAAPGLLDRDQPARVSTGPTAVADQRSGSSTSAANPKPGEPAVLSAEPHACEAPEGADTDVASEPDWRQYAAYLPWTDRDGCLLRIDVLAERPGPDHCGWTRARVLITGEPLGTPYTSPADATEYVRDPEGVFDRPDLTAGFDPNATLPGDAVDSGYRRDDLALWHVPDDPSAIWLVSPEGVEQWPAGVSPGCV